MNRRVLSSPLLAALLVERFGPVSTLHLERSIRYASIADLRPTPRALDDTPAAIRARRTILLAAVAHRGDADGEVTA